MSAIVAAIGTAVAGIAVAGASMYSANKQAGAAKSAQQISQNQYANTVALENPYNQSGMAAQNQLNYLLGTGGDTTGANTTHGAAGSLLSPFTADMMKQYSPAYQFQLQQGQQGVLNGSASGQGALSGAASLGLEQYNQANANTAFASANNIYQQQQSNIYQRLADTAQRGQAAASGTAQQGTALAGQAAQSAQNQGNAYANGINGAAGAIGNAAQTGSMWAMYGGGGGGGGYGGVNTNPVINYTDAAPYQGP
jgi:hypothetical protein